MAWLTLLRVQAFELLAAFLMRRIEGNSARSADFARFDVTALVRSAIAHEPRSYSPTAITENHAGPRRRRGRCRNAGGRKLADLLDAPTRQHGAYSLGTIMRALDVMTTGIVSVSRETQAADAARLMRERRIHHLLVKDGSVRAGIVSDRDLGGRLSATVTGSRTVGRVMSPHVVTVDAHATVRQIANVMRGRTIGCVVVTDHERTVGFITSSDLLALIGRGVTHPVEHSGRRMLHHRTTHRHKAVGSGVW